MTRCERLIGAALAMMIAGPAAAMNTAVQACLDKATGGEQKAWDAYRNAECGGVVGGGAWGSGTAVMVIGCYAEKSLRAHSGAENAILPEMRAGFDETTVLLSISDIG